MFPMFVFFKKKFRFLFPVEGDHRVIRGCGWVHNYGMLENRTCFNRAGTNQVGGRKDSAMKINYFVKFIWWS